MPVRPSVSASAEPVMTPSMPISCWATGDGARLSAVRSRSGRATRKVTDPVLADALADRRGREGAQLRRCGPAEHELAVDHAHREVARVRAQLVETAAQRGHARALGRPGLDEVGQRGLGLRRVAELGAGDGGVGVALQVELAGQEFGERGDVDARALLERRGLAAVLVVLRRARSSGSRRSRR